MLGERTESHAKPLVVVVFALFYLMNIVLLATALLIAFRGSTLELLSEDIGLGWRIILFLIGGFLSWCLGRWLYQSMVEAKVSVSDSGMAAMAQLLYLLLIFTGAIFLGSFSWVWQGVLLTVLSLLTFLSVSRVIGISASVMVIVGCALCGVAYFLMAS